MSYLTTKHLQQLEGLRPQIVDYGDIWPEEDLNRVLHCFLPPDDYRIACERMKKTFAVKEIGPISGSNFISWRLFCRLCFDRSAERPPVNQFNADNKLFWESPRDLHLLSPLARYGQKKLEEFLAHYLSEFSAMMKKEFLERPEEGEKRYSRSRVGLSDSREILKEDAEFKTRGISKLFNIIVDLDRKNGISLGKKFLLCSNHYSERETTLKAFYCQRLAEKFAIFGFHAPADLRVEFEEKKIFDLNAKALSLSEQVVSRILGEETA